MPNSQQTAAGPVASMRAIWANHVSETTATAVVWANERGKHDPNWEHKQHLIADAVAAAIARDGYPQSQAATIALVDKAFDRVNILLRSLGL